VQRVVSVLAAHSRVIFCVRKTLDYFFAGQAFSGYFLLFLALVQISQIVSARGVGGESFLLQFLRPSYVPFQNSGSCPNERY